MWCWCRQTGRQLSMGLCRHVSYLSRHKLALRCKGPGRVDPPRQGDLRVKFGHGPCAKGHPLACVLRRWRGRWRGAAGCVMLALSLVCFAGDDVSVLGTFVVVGGGASGVVVRRHISRRLVSLDEVCSSAALTGIAVLGGGTLCWPVCHAAIGRQLVCAARRGFSLALERTSADLLSCSARSRPTCRLLHHQHLACVVAWRGVQTYALRTTSLVVRMASAMARLVQCAIRPGSHKTRFEAHTRHCVHLGMVECTRPAASL